MKNRKAKPTLKSAIAVALSLFLLAWPQLALAWGTATHVYIGKRLGHQLGLANANEMYGSTLPDFPTLMFGSPYTEFLFNQTHYEFLKLVRLAPLGYPRAFAYGFASHNEKWGADYTAHKKALTGGTEGYIIQKSKAIESDVYQALLNFLPPEVAYQLAPLLAEVLVESAIDLLLAENEFKEVGIEMMLAAGLRDASVPNLLASAYAKALASQARISESQAASLLKAAESRNREYVLTYGAILAQPNRRQLLAQSLADLLEQMLAASYNVTVEVDPHLVLDFLNSAAELVRWDYNRELEATIKFVGTELTKHWIFTSLVP